MVLGAVRRLGVQRGVGLWGRAASWDGGWFGGRRGAGERKAEGQAGYRSGVEVKEMWPTPTSAEGGWQGRRPTEEHSTGDPGCVIGVSIAFRLVAQAETGAP